MRVIEAGNSEKFRDGSPVELLHEKLSWPGREVHSLFSSMGYGRCEQKKKWPLGREKRGHPLVQYGMMSSTRRVRELYAESSSALGGRVESERVVPTSSSAATAGRSCRYAPSSRTAWRIHRAVEAHQASVKNPDGASLVMSFRRVLSQRARRRHSYSLPLKQVAAPKRGEVERQWRPERYNTLHER